MITKTKRFMPAAIELKLVRFSQTDVRTFIAGQNRVIQY